jgi:hypothetical protein
VRMEESSRVIASAPTSAAEIVRTITEGQARGSAGHPRNARDRSRAASRFEMRFRRPVFQAGFRRCGGGHRSRSSILTGLVAVETVVTQLPRSGPDCSRRASPIPPLDVLALKPGVRARNSCQELIP